MKVTGPNPGPNRAGRTGAYSIERLSPSAHRCVRMPVLPPLSGVSPVDSGLRPRLTIASPHRFSTTSNRQRLCWSDARPPPAGSRIDLPPENWSRLNVSNWARKGGWIWHGSGIRRSRSFEGCGRPKLLTTVRAGWGARTLRVLGAGLVVFAATSWFLAILLWPAKLAEQPYPNLEEDIEAADFLRSLDYGRRALILPGPTNKEEVNTNGWEGMHRFVVSFGATAVPMGLDRWGAAHLYQPYYLPAYNSMDEPAMAELGIDTIYVAPHLLDAGQEQRLADAVASGRASLLFESSAGHRRIYAYDPR